MLFNAKKIQNSINDLIGRLKKKPELIIFGFYAFAIIFLINKIPIGPDEYLYSAIAKNFANSFRGEACFSCIDPYHTFLLPLLISFFNFLTGIDSFIIYRFIIGLFSIGSIFLIHKLFTEIFRGHNIVSLIFLLLFPGFFYYGCMVRPDNLAFFFFVFLIFLIIKKKSYWKIGIVLSLLFFSKEYYIIFGGFVVCVAILYDAFIENKEKSIFWKLKFLLQNFVAAFLFAVLVFFSIELFPILPYPNLLGVFIMELFGWDIYMHIGTYAKELIYGININDKTSGNVLNNPDNLDIISRNINIANENIKNIGRYSKIFFKEIYVNLYVLPLVFYGIFINFKNREFRDSRNKIIMFSILLIFFVFSIRIGALDEFDFRIALVLIIPFFYFIFFAVVDLFKNEKIGWRHIFFYLLSFIYIAFQLLEIQKLSSGSILATSELVQIFLKYKLLINLFFYGFPMVIMLSRLEVKFKKKMLIFWLIVVFFYKTGPEIINSYLARKVSDVEYNLNHARNVLSEIEKKEPRVLTNHERAYYYYSNAVKMPNNTRDSLPIIRPRFNIIYDRRVFELNENSWTNIVAKNLLCEQNIGYIFFVNKQLDDGAKAKNIINIKGITLVDDFYKNNNLNWVIYKFDNKMCK